MDVFFFSSLAQSIFLLVFGNQCTANRKTCVPCESYRDVRYCEKYVQTTRSICKRSNRLFSCIHSYVRLDSTVRRKTMELTVISVVKNYPNFVLAKIDAISARKILNRVSVNMVKVAHKNHDQFYWSPLCR